MNTMYSVERWTKYGKAYGTYPDADEGAARRLYSRMPANDCAVSIARFSLVENGPHYKPGGIVWERDGIIEQKGIVKYIPNEDL